jgi:hypothetical protein
MNKPQFIHFGCWGELNNYPNFFPHFQTVMNCLESYITKNTNIKFLTIAGDNYYSYKDKSERPKTKTFIEENFVHIMESLKENSRDIPKYILWGNHEIDDLIDYYVEYSDQIGRETEKTIIDENDKQCFVLNKQLEWITKNKDHQFKNFQNVDINTEFKNTLVIMLDTTIYFDDTLIDCYNKYNILSGEEQNASHKNIQEIREKQLEQVRYYLIDGANKKNIIFIGHHPLYICTNKTMNKEEGEKGNGWNNHIKYFYEALKEELKQKKIYHLCADTHCYQKTTVHIPNIPIITQYIVGTGGAQYHKCKNSCASIKNNIIQTTDNQTPGFLRCIFNKENPSGDEWEFFFKNCSSDIAGKNIQRKKIKKKRRSKKKKKDKWERKKVKYNKTKGKKKQK